jgi:predicted transcriptional regulator
MKISPYCRICLLIFLVVLSLVSNPSPPFIRKTKATPLKITFDSTFGSLGSGDGQFNNPRGVAANSTHIFVTDEVNFRIQIFDLAGNFAAKFGSFGTGNGQFDNAFGVAVNNTHIFVADSNNNRIQIFDLAGNFAAKFGNLGSGDGEFNYPNRVAINSTHIFVTDTYNDRIQIFDLAGNFVAKFGSTGSGDGQFNFPRGVTINSTHIFVTGGTPNNRVQIFDLAGNFVTKFGSSGGGDGQFNFPVGVVVNGSHIFIADSGNDRIQIFDLAGNFVKNFGSSGTGNGQFKFPSGVASSGTFLFVADFNNHRIQKIFVQTITPIAHEFIPKIVIVYSIPQELDAVENVITSNFLSVENSFMNFTNFNNFLLNNSDMLIILGTNNFTLSTENQASIQDFVNQEKKSIITLTPYIGQFNSSLANLFGISDFNETYPTGSSSEIWDLELNKTLDSINIGTNVTFEGQFGVFDKNPNSETIAFVAGSNSIIPEIQALNFPLPAIINSSTTTSQIITGSISPIPISVGGLHLNQIPIFEDLISEVIVAAITNHIERNEIIDIPTGTDTTSTSTSDDTSRLTDNPSDPNLSIENFLWMVILGIIALLFLFRNKILWLLRWFEKKFFGIIVGIIGSVYSIQNRNLATSQVLINQTRAKILDYLEFIAESGSHFREIKSVVRVGTGILLWHLQVLEDFGFITQYKIDRYNIFVAYEFNEEFSIEEKRLEIKFRSKHAINVFENLIQIEEQDKLNISEFSKLASVDRKTIKKHLEILEGEEIVKLEKTSYGVEIIKIDKAKIEKLLNRIKVKDEYKDRGN